MKRFIIPILIVAMLLTACSSETAYENQKPLIYTSFYPLYFLAKEIGGSNIDLEIVVPTGVEVHGYEPTIDQLKDIEKADLLIYNGSGLELWADKVLGNILSKDKSINASDLAEMMTIDGGVDPHLWLDPQNMIAISGAIKDEFISLDRENQEEYERKHGELVQDLKKLDEAYSEALKDKNRKTILVSHKAFGYMAKAYDLEQVSVTGINPDGEPDPKTIASIIDLARDENFEYIFLETLTSSKTVDVISREADLKTLVLNPLGGLTEEEEKNGEDYISIMEENLKNLEKALVN